MRGNGLTLFVAKAWIFFVVQLLLYWFEVVYIHVKGLVAEISCFNFFDGGMETAFFERLQQVFSKKTLQKGLGGHIDP
ncbi:MAG: hypothetical protein IPK46_03995 [Saprospiraceae bacterium]|nr:hypothetical protein [Saprospiraceae bacterium]